MMASPMNAFKKKSQSTDILKSSIFEETDWTEALNSCVGEVNIFNPTTFETSSMIGTLVFDNIVLTSSAALLPKGKKISKNDVTFTLSKDKKQTISKIERIIISEKEYYKGIAILTLKQDIQMEAYPQLIEEDEESDEMDLIIAGIQTNTKGVKTVSQTKKFKKLPNNPNQIISSEEINNVKAGAPLIILSEKKVRVVGFSGSAKQMQKMGKIPAKNAQKINGILITEELIQNFLNEIGISINFAVERRKKQTQLYRKSSASSAPGQSFIKTYHQFDEKEFQDQMAQFQKRDYRTNMKRANIGLIYDEIDNNFGTGFLISQRVVLTAAHVVYPCRKNLSRTFFYPELNGSRNSAIDKYEIVSYKIPRAYINAKRSASKDCMEEDYALLFLKQKVPRKSYLMLGYDLSTDFKAQICGYPLDRVKQGQYQDEFCQSGMSDDIYVEKNKIGYEMTTQSGQSGSPICVCLAEFTNCVVGVHSGANPTKKKNEGCLLTYAKLKQIKKWIRQFDPSQQHTFKCINLANFEQSKISKSSCLNSLTMTRQIEQKTEEILRAESQNAQQNEILIKKVEMAKIYRAHSQQSDSKEYLETILKEQYRKQDATLKQEVIHLYYELGICQRDSNEFDDALDSLFRALKIVEKIFVNPQNQIAACIHNSIGTVYERRGQAERNKQAVSEIYKYAEDHYNIAYEIESGLSKVSQIKLAIYSINRAGIRSMKPNITKDQLNGVFKDYYQAIKTLESKQKTIPYVKGKLVSCYFNSAILFAKWRMYNIWLTNSLAGLNLEKEIINERTKAKFINRYFLPFLQILPLYFDSKYFKSMTNRSEVEKTLLDIAILIEFYCKNDESLQVEKEVTLDLMKLL